MGVAIHYFTYFYWRFLSTLHQTYQKEKNTFLEF